MQPNVKTDINTVAVWRWNQNEVLHIWKAIK